MKASIFFNYICLDDDDCKIMDVSYRIGCLFSGYLFYTKAEGYLDNDEVFMFVTIAGIVRKSMAFREHIKRNERAGHDVNPLLSKFFTIDAFLLVLQAVWLALHISQNTIMLDIIDNAFTHEVNTAADVQYIKEL